VDFHVPELISDIARSMGLCKNSIQVPTIARMQVLAIMNAILNFISGESFFSRTLNLKRETYAAGVEETLKFVLIPSVTTSGS
jgi:hypothetical protein